MIAPKTVPPMLTERRLVDVVELLLEQHAQLRRLARAVAAASGPDRMRQLRTLAALLHQHEFGEMRVVHPALRDHTRDGTKNPTEDGIRIADACTAEEEQIWQQIAELQDVDTGDPAFEPAFAAFHRTLLNHLKHEERDEFPRLRQLLPSQRLHLMANELRNVQAMC